MNNEKPIGLSEAVGVETPASIRERELEAARLEMKIVQAELQRIKAIAALSAKPAEMPEMPEVEEWIENVYFHAYSSSGSAIPVESVRAYLQQLTAAHAAELADLRQQVRDSKDWERNTAEENVRLVGVIARKNGAEELAEDEPASCNRAAQLLSDQMDAMRVAHAAELAEKDAEIESWKSKAASWEQWWQELPSPLFHGLREPSEVELAEAKEQGRREALMGVPVGAISYAAPWIPGTPDGDRVHAELCAFIESARAAQQETTK